MNCRDNLRNLEVLDKKQPTPSGRCGILLLIPTNKKAKKNLLRYKI